MRGQRNPLNENGDGEVDENFWAQAAADQAAGRAAADGDEGKVAFSGPGMYLTPARPRASRRWKFDPIQYSVLPRRRRRRSWVRRRL
jgi:hypothetical protein